MMTSSNLTRLQERYVRDSVPMLTSLLITFPSPAWPPWPPAVSHNCSRLTRPSCPTHHHHQKGDANPPKDKFSLRARASIRSVKEKPALSREGLSSNQEPSTTRDPAACPNTRQLSFPAQSPRMEHKPMRPALVAALVLPL